MPASCLSNWASARLNPESSTLKLAIGTLVVYYKEGNVIVRVTEMQLDSGPNVWNSALVVGPDGAKN
jgi:hypothetical protein